MKPRMNPHKRAALGLKGGHVVVEPEDNEQERVSLADLIPVQYSDPVAVRIQMSGEYRLLWAVLEDAIDCYFRYATQPSAEAQELFREAAAWIESEEEEWLCSFRGICSAFRINPDHLRRGLRRRLQEILKGRYVTRLPRAA
jgi:hypothetical protein